MRGTTFIDFDIYHVIEGKYCKNCTPRTLSTFEGKKFEMLISETVIAMIARAKMHPRLNRL